MKICDMIPSLKLYNFNVANVEPKHMTKYQLNIVFQVINDILEINSPATQEEKAVFERYQNSFLRKRILRYWELKRAKIKAYAACEFSRKLEIYQEVFVGMKPILTGRFYEEYGENIEINALTFRAFLWNQGYISRKFKQYQDSEYWSETLQLVDFLGETQTLHL